MAPLSIYLADLTYTTLSLATEAFPLNIGFVASSCEKKFGGDVRIRLFKYIDDLDAALRDEPPHILGMSNYPWNQNADFEFFRMIRTGSPSTLRIMGGPNISQDASEQTKFMEHHPEVDAYCILEGEDAFSHIVERVLSGSTSRKLVFTGSIPGVIFRREDGTIARGTPIPRRTVLDEIPSPYLAGLMDPFFDGKLSPLLETNRGCPFSCTFCHEGNSLISKVNYFSVERAIAELDYVAAHVPAGVANLMFADPNFGMFERDFEICEHIAKIQERQSWPKFIFASTGKNQKERIGRSLKKLNGSMKLWMSVQSMDETVLREIKRDNIKLSHMIGLRETFTEMGLTTFSELILGLPGETYESHVTSIAKLVDSGIDQITTYTCMLLEGTELATPASRAKHGIQSRFRVIPRDFARLSNGRVAVEIEEVVTSTNTLSFEEYCRLRNFHLIINVVCNGQPFGPLLKFMRERAISVSELLHRLIDGISAAPESVRTIVDSFARNTREELWSSREELNAHLQTEANYEKLLSEKIGANLIQTHIAKSHRVMSAWCDYVFSVAAQALSSRWISASEDTTAAVTESILFEDIRSYCRGRVHNIWGSNRNDDNPAYPLQYDVRAWFRSSDSRPLTDYHFENPREFRFEFSNEQKEISEKFIERFGTTSTGIGRILVKTDMTKIWRDSLAAVSSNASRETGESGAGAVLAACSPATDSRS